MKERIIEFLRKENKTSAQLADEIGVQPSGISHIISGRNNPSLDFVLKMLDKYKYISSDWLLFGKGPMYKEPLMQDLFSEPASFDNETATFSTPVSNDNGSPDKELMQIHDTVNIPEKEVIRIVLFFNNNTFEEFHPAKK